MLKATLVDWLNDWSISRRFIQYGEETERSKSRLLISCFLHTINIQRRCCMEYAVIIIPNYISHSIWVLIYFFNILKVSCKRILEKKKKKASITKSQDFPVHSYFSFFKSDKPIPNGTRLCPEPFILEVMQYFSWTNNWHFLNMSFANDSVKVAASFQVSCSHKWRLLSFRHLLSLMRCLYLHVVHIALVLKT